MHQFTQYICTRMHKLYLLPSADIFKINFFKKFFQQHYQRVKGFGFGAGPKVLLVLIWVQTVCKGQQKVAASKERVTYLTRRR